jgi:tRNA-modifying protein YgfZ
MDKFFDFPGADTGWICPFRPTACLHVTGEDALTFLQGQFTQELRSTATSPVAYGLWLNQKGKVLADSFILREAPDSVWVISFSSSAQVICERLEAYVIADDVLIEDVTEEWSGVTIGGAMAETWLAREAGGIPETGEFSKVAEGGWVFRGRRGDESSFEWVRPVDSPLPAALVKISPEARERLRINAGVPRVPQDIGVGDLPNEGGLDESGISYTKGCYLGQEVMARLKAMGTVRRRLVRVRGSGRGVPAVPCALLQGEKRVGELRSAVTDGAEGFIGLAMITKLGLDPVAKLAPEPGGDGFIELVELP